MNKDYTTERELLDKYNQGHADPNDKDRIEMAFNRFAATTTDACSAVDEEVAQRIWARLPPSVMRVQVNRFRKIKYVACTAAALACIASGVWFFANKSRSDQSHIVLSDNAPGMAAGRQGATLTLANGQKINLSGASAGELARQAGVRIRKTAQGDIIYEAEAGSDSTESRNTLSTERGQTYVLHLPDGSTVWLNAASSLSYRSTLLEKGKRVVELSGEGYFEVKKGKQPFIVKTHNQQVEVLGTKFNISSYDDEGITATTLAEGSVKVGNRSSNLLLIPGQQALNNGTSLEVRTVDVSEVNAWKDGYFRFNDEKLLSIVNNLERWYDVEILLGPGLAERQFTGKISRKRTLQDVLNLLKKTNDIIFKVEGRRVSIIEN